ncbi:nudix hydrolase 9 isoform X2 [Cryptomeria japonica]|uniref:nudix hydrolase 9 isoform X2 n=1 Tax=Cryptomeria japonica TaxID=3369 RepID=UPI0025ABAC9B|nr:nudix hydrolase 9 isoform X2 [Cryptomeria japonica]
MASSKGDGSHSHSYRLLLACPTGLSRSQVTVDFSSSHDRKPHPDPTIEGSIEEYGGYATSSPTEESIGATKICLCLGLTDYRTFIGTNLSPVWEQFLLPVKDDVEQCKYTSSPLGNGAIVETIDNFILVLRRSHSVGEFPGHLVFPGGHSEPEEVGISGHVYTNDKTFTTNLNSKISAEMFDGIVREVVEEIGVPAQSLSDPIFIGISRRVTNVRPTVFFYIKCSLHSSDIQGLYSKAKDGYESTHLCIMPKYELGTAASEMPGCHQGGFALYDLMTKEAKSR